MNELLNNYYNKFNEDKRLETRHGIVEFQTTIKYIKEVLEHFNKPKILDVGAGTGKYSLYLSNLGYDITAVELVKHNLKVIESKSKKVKTYLGNALNLEFLGNETYDVILLFGPIYHLFGKDKVGAIKEVLKHLKHNGYLLIVYCLNDFAILKHGFIDGHILDDNMYDDKFIIKDNKTTLYSFDTFESIANINKICHLKREKLISQEGMTEYIRPIINKMSIDEFNKYLEFHFQRCESPYYLGYSRHVLDIVKKDIN